MFRFVRVCSGEVRQLWQCKLGSDMVVLGKPRYGTAVVARFSWEGLGIVRRGVAVMARWRKAGTGRARQSRRGELWLSVERNV